MSYERRKKKRKYKSSFRISIIAFIFIYLAFRSIPIFLANTTKTVLPIEEVVIQRISSEAIIIKDEVVYRAQGSGQLNSSIKEGERVPAGIEVVTINLLEDTSQLKLELIEIENAIISLSITDKDMEYIQNEKNKITEKQDKLVQSLQTYINLGNYEKISNTKSELALYDNKSIDINVDNNFLDENLDSLKERRNILQDEINSNNIKYLTANSGIVSYLIDGYENIYLPHNFEDYTYENLNQTSIDETNIIDEEVQIGSAVFKIIDNFQWYIALKIVNKEDVSNYEIGDNITLQFEKDDKELMGNIETINNSDDKTVLIVKLNNFLHEYYKLRFSKVNIIKSKKHALKIPSKVITEKDGQEGVFIREINGIVKFRPISIVAVQKDYTFIDKGDLKGHISLLGKEDTAKTVSLYDEIFTKTINIKEGQILN